MTKDEIRRMSNEDLVSRFVAYVGADYRSANYSTDSAPHVYPRLSEKTRKLWDEIVQRMSGVVTLGFDRNFFEQTMYDETKIQKDIINSGSDKSTSYHVGVTAGLNLAFKIATESMKVEQEDEDKS